MKLLLIALLATSAVAGMVYTEDGQTTIIENGQVFGEDGYEGVYYE